MFGDQPRFQDDIVSEIVRDNSCNVYCSATDVKNSISCIPTTYIAMQRRLKIANLGYSCITLNVMSCLFPLPVVVRMREFFECASELSCKLNQTVYSDIFRHAKKS